MPHKFYFFNFILCIFISGCVVGFSNSKNNTQSEYSKIYIPSAKDNTIYSGNSSRLTFAIRSVLASHSNIEITSLSQARVALVVKILDRNQTIVAVDNCRNPGTSTVASLAFRCSEIHPELTNPSVSSPYSFNQPSISPSSESVSLVVDVKAIDLNNGQLLWTKRYFAGNIPAAVFNEIGDADNRTSSMLSNQSQLHGLRYQEALDNAVQSFSNSIAVDLQTSLFNRLFNN